MAMSSNQRDKLSKETASWVLWQSELRSRTAQDAAASPYKVRHSSQLQTTWVDPSIPPSHSRPYAGTTLIDVLIRTPKKYQQQKVTTQFIKSERQDKNDRDARQIQGLSAFNTEMTRTPNSYSTHPHVHLVPTTCTLACSELQQQHVEAVEFQRQQARIERTEAAIEAC